MSGEKTEEPTHKKLEDARKKGQVAVSKDLMILIQLSLVFTLFFFVIRKVASWFTEYADSLYTNVMVYGWQDIYAHLIDGRDLFIKAVAMFFGCSILGGLIGVFAQIGFLFAPEAIKPSFKKLNAVENVKNMFSMKSITQLLISVLKVIFLLVIFYFVFTNKLDVMLLSYRGGFDAVMTVLLILLRIVIYTALLLFVVLSITDWAVVFFFHRKNLRMSKQEVFDEYKQQEGDPHMKGHRKQTHRSLINSSISSVGKAKAVVSNPTHIAVALDYEPGVHDLPFILAIEDDEFAYLLRKEAYERGVPVIRQVELARGLYLDGEVGQYIPSRYIKLAAGVFREVMAMVKAAEEEKKAQEQGEQGPEKESLENNKDVKEVTSSHEPPPDLSTSYASDQPRSPDV